MSGSWLEGVEERDNEFSFKILRHLHGDFLPVARIRSESWKRGEN